MIIDYDHNPHLRFEQKLQSLKESVQMALSEKDKQIDELSKALIALSERVSALEPVAEDAITIDRSAE